MAGALQRKCRTFPGSSPADQAGKFSGIGVDPLQHVTQVGEKIDRASEGVRYPSERIGPYLCSGISSAAFGESCPPVRIQAKPRVRCSVASAFASTCILFDPAYPT